LLNMRRDPSKYKERPPSLLNYSHEEVKKSINEVKNLVKKT